MDAAIETRITDALKKADALWSAHEYWEVHEVLEHVWVGCAGIDRSALSGLILLAAALHKSRKQRHPRAARQIYARALAHLAPLPDVWRGIDLRAMERMTFDAIRDLETPTKVVHYKRRERNAR